MKKHSVSILAAGVLWGFMGLFRRYMADIGVSTAGVIILRCGVSTVFFAITLLATDTSYFRVKLRDA